MPGAAREALAAWHKRAYDVGAGLLPPRLAARIDYVLRGFRTPSLESGPLNGQVRRQQAIRELVGAIPFVEVVETGTFRGASTEFFAALTGLPVYSARVTPVPRVRPT